MPDVKRSYVSNPHGEPPMRMIERQILSAGARPRWLRDYVKWREMGLGTRDITFRDIEREIVGYSMRDRDTFIEGRLKPLQDRKLLSYRIVWYGANRASMEIHINDINEKQLKRLLDEEVSENTEVKALIDAYVESYVLYAEGELHFANKDRGLARDLCREYPLPRLKAMLKDFFAMRQGRLDEGLRPDYRFVTFYNMRAVLVANERERRRDEATRRQMHRDGQRYDEALERAKKEREKNPESESNWAKKKRRKWGDNASLSDRRARRRSR